jgi:hypothetical protein
MTPFPFVFLCFLIAAIIFFLDALFGGAAPYTPYSGRAQAFAFGLVCVGLLCWHGGVG